MVIVWRLSKGYSQVVKTNGLNCWGGDSKMELLAVLILLQYNNEHKSKAKCAIIFLNGYFDVIPYRYNSPNGHLVSTS